MAAVLAVLFVIVIWWVATHGKGMSGPGSRSGWQPWQSAWCCSAPQSPAIRWEDLWAGLIRLCRAWKASLGVSNSLSR